MDISLPINIMSGPENHEGNSTMKKKDNTNPDIIYQGYKAVINLVQIEELYSTVLQHNHIAEELGISAARWEQLRNGDELGDEVKSRLLGAMKRGRSKLRKEASGFILDHAKKNAAAAMYLASQEFVLGLVNPMYVKHEHSGSVQLAVMKGIDTPPPRPSIDADYEDITDKG